MKKKFSFSFNYNIDEGKDNIAKVRIEAARNYIFLEKLTLIKL